MVCILASLLFLGFSSYGEGDSIGKEVSSLEGNLENLVKQKEQVKEFSSERILIVRMQEENLKKTQVEDFSDSHQGNRPFESVIKFKSPRLEDLSPERRELATEEEIEEAIEEAIEEEEVRAETNKKESFSERQIFSEISYSKSMEKQQQQQQQHINIFDKPEGRVVTVRDFFEKLLIYEILDHIDRHYGEQIELFLEKHPYIEVFFEKIKLKDNSVIVYLYIKEF